MSLLTNAPDHDNKTLYSHTGAATHVKTDMTFTYTESTPHYYIEFLSPLRYGLFQDRLTSFLAPTRRAIKEATDNPRLFDIGALYGNTTLALTSAMDWESTCAFWREPRKLKTNYHVTALDLSAEALSFGLNTGIYHKTFVADMNDPFSEPAAQALKEADVLTCVMALNYSVDGRWEEICKQFLKDRSRDKFIIYSTVCAFDDRDFSPSGIFRDAQSWHSQAMFSLHREFSAQEREAHYGCRESWCWTYSVKFDKE